MRILEVIDNLNVGGAEVLLMDLCREWCASGLDVTVYLLNSSDGWIERQVQINGARVVHSGLRSLYSPRQIARLAGHLRRSEYDVIHVHLFPAQLWVRVAVGLLRLRTPLVTTEHNTWNRRRSFAFRLLDRFTYKGYDRVVCISEAVAAHLQAWLEPWTCRSCVIPNGIDASRFSNTRAAVVPSANSGQARLLCVGSLSERKNQAVLIRALAQLPGAGLVLVGEGPRRSFLENLAGELGVRDRVQFAGERSDVPEFLANADIYIQPSVVDGFCLAVVEAMAAGLPVVASDVPGMREVVADGGLLFNPHDPEGLAAAVNKLLRDSPLRERLTNQARARSGAFGVAMTAAHYRSLYGSLCEERSREEGEAGLARREPAEG